jgi:hypothetical protein
MKVFLGILTLILLTNRGLCGPIENFFKTVHYTAPTNFFTYDPKAAYVTNENFTDPFSIGEYGMEYNCNDQCSSLIFQLDLACYYLGEGKIYKFLPAKPTDLKEDFEKFCKSDLIKLTNMPPATFVKVGGLTAVCSTTTRPPGFGAACFHFCWVQIETNIVVKISVASCDAKTFNALTNSLQSLKIDKKGILERVASQKQLRFPW